MHDANIVTILAYALGIIGIAGGVVGYFGKSRGDSIIKYQAQELQLRDGTLARLDKEGAGKDERIKSLEEQVATLKELAQGSPQLVKLTRQISKLATEVAKIARGDHG